KVSPAPVGASFPNFSDWRKHNQVFQELAAYRERNPILTGGDEPARLTGQAVSPEFFAVLGVEAMLGRTFSADEKAAANERPIVLSHGFWRRRFGADRNVLGRTLTLNNSPYTIIGVMPPGFRFAREVDIWTPLDAPALLQRMRGARFLAVVGRLKPHLTVEQARAGMETLSRQLAGQYPETNAGWSVSLTPLPEKFIGQAPARLWLLAGAVGLVLLIACVNVANLLLARAATRRREMAIRLALGANRMRLARQSLTESLLLSALGGGLGLLIALWIIPLMLAVTPGDIPRIDQVSLDGAALGFTLAVSLLTSLLFGLAPAIRASKPELNSALKEGSAYQSGGLHTLRRQRLRSLLVVSEIALALALTISAGLLSRSLFKLTAVNPGLRAENAISMQISLPQYKYPQEPQQIAFFSQLLE